MTVRDYLKAFKEREPEIASSARLIQGYLLGAEMCEGNLACATEYKTYPFMDEDKLARCLIEQDVNLNLTLNARGVCARIARLWSRVGMFGDTNPDSLAAELWWKVQDQLIEPSSHLELDCVYDEDCRENDSNWFEAFRERPKMYLERDTPADMVVYMKGYLHFKSLRFPDLPLSSQLNEIFSARGQGTPYLLEWEEEGVQFSTAVSEPLAIYWNSRWDEPGAREEFWKYWEPFFDSGSPA